jgi:ABC-type nitrate/sulfonate/bicarbonate transport system permease component
VATVAGDANAVAAGSARAKWPRALAWTERHLAEARPTVVALAAGLVFWELAGRLLHFSFLPPFSLVLQTTFSMIADGQILAPLAASLAALAAGYGLAASSGIGLGLLMGRYRKIEYIFDPYINLFLATPKIALVPILFALFGVHRSVQVAVVFLSAFFIIVINTMSAVRTVDASYVEMARSFGARESQLFWKVLLPGSLPLTMAGARLGMGRAVKGMINGEMYIALFGLGALLRTYGSRFDAARVFAILLVVVAVALVCSSLVRVIERRLTRWMEPAP